MLNNYIKLVLRNIQKHKGYAFINITGLALGMACTILILLWVQDELSYDRFHEYSSRLFRVIDKEVYTNGETITFSSNAPALASTLQENHPQIIKTARVRKQTGVVLEAGDLQFNEDGMLLSDASLFDLFSYTMLSGNPATALSNPNSIVITESIADKYFGTTDVLGKTMQLDNQTSLMVTGVMQNVPGNSHLQFDFIVPLEIAKTYQLITEGWNRFIYTTYVLLAEGVDYHDVSPQIAQVVKEHQETLNITLSLQPVPDIHLHSGNIWGIGGTGDIKYVTLFTLIAGFILLIACINFMNLSTARASERAREVGIRKVVGAGRKLIIQQFFGESIFLSALSLILALVIVSLCTPAFNTLSGKELTLNLIDNPAMALMLAGITLLTGLVSGIYPAFFLSSFVPVKVLKGTIKSSSKGTLFRRTLVSLQYVITIALIISTLIISKQVKHIQNTKLGYNKEQVISVPLKGDLYQKADMIKDKFQASPFVLNASTTSYLPSNISRSFVTDEWDGRKGNEQFLIHVLSADYDFTKTLDIQMAEGRYFSRAFPSDSSDGCIVNQAAIEAMNMNAPIGKHMMSGKIIGVINDFHYKSLHQEIGPLLIYFSPEDMKHLLIRIKPGSVSSAIEELETIWQSIVPEFPFEYHFLDDTLEALYNTEKQVEQIMNIFTILGLAIASLGLFGLASYTAEQRRKEIGIRKVIGAETHEIIIMLCSEFTRWVLVANIIAWPVAYWGVRQWLQNYAYRVNITIAPFLLAGLSALLIAVLTVSWQATRAATANPIKALKYE